MDEASKDVSMSDHTSSGRETDVDFVDSGSEYKPESEENDETKPKRKKVYKKRQTKKDGSIAVSEKKVNPKNAPRKICPICNKSIKTLSKHMKIHNERSRLQCHLCSCVYSRKDTLKRHLLKYHRNAENAVDAAITEYNCDECSSIFMTRVKLTAHKRERHPNINYVRVSCNICRRTYANAANLRKHLCNVRIAIECDICLQSFPTYKDLSHHLQTHLTPPTFTDTNGTTAPITDSTDMVFDRSEQSDDALNGQVSKAVGKSGTSAQLLCKAKSAPSPVLENNAEMATDPDVQKPFQSNSEIELLDQPKIERSTVESNSLAADDIVEKDNRKIAKSDSERSLVQQESSTPIDCDMENALPANSENDAEQPTTKSDKKKRKMDTCKSAPSSPLLENNTQMEIDPDVHKAFQSNSHIELLDQPKIKRCRNESNSLAVQGILEKLTRKIAKSESKRSLVQQQSTTPIDCHVKEVSSSNFETVTEAKSLLHSDDVHINDKRKIDIYDNEVSAVVRKNANRIDSDLENGLASNSDSLLEARNTIIDEINEMSRQTCNSDTMEGK